MIRFRWRTPVKPARRLVLFAVALALGATSAFFVPQVAYAAPPTVTGTLCKDRYNISQPAADSDPLPGDGPSPWDDVPTYNYDNPAEHLRGSADKVTGWENLKGQALQDKLDDLTAIYGDSTDGKTVGTEDHLYAARVRYIKKQVKAGKPIQGWTRWLNGYIPNQSNAAKGASYETLFIEGYRLGGPNWYCQATIDIPECQGRVFDLVNPEALAILELKSNGKPEVDQLAIDEACLGKLKSLGYKYRMRYHFGRTPSKTNIDKVQQSGDIEARTTRANPVQTNKVPTGGAKVVDPAGNASGAGDEFMTNSADTAQDAALADDTFTYEADQAALDNAKANGISAAQAEMTAMDDADLRPGGVDFTTMELRYVSVDGGNVQYAFKAQESADDLHSFGGLAAGELSSDALFTWLALPESAFWVNLNPDEPDRIIDPRLGTTDAGRVLLQADLQMKKTAAKLLDPNTPAGGQFWDQAQGVDGAPPCITFRNWIVPQPATVRENGSELYVLDAPLLVKSAPIGIKTPPAGGSCPSQPQAITDHNEQVFEDVIVPKITEAVNTAPEYEDLRRVYLSRVIAEWLRQRSAAQPNAYTSIIDSGDVSRWPARTKWNPQDVYQAYVKSYKDGEFTYTITRQSNGQQVTYSIVVGGVDFSQSPTQPIDQTAFTQKWPTLPTTVHTAKVSLVSDLDADRTWLGAGNVPVSNPPPGQPPAGGGHSLPVTGTPVALVGGIGAGLVVVGVLLVVWTRRRRNPQRD